MMSHGDVSVDMFSVFKEQFAFGISFPILGIPPGIHHCMFSPCLLLSAIYIPANAFEALHLDDSTLSHISCVRMWTPVTSLPFFVTYFFF